MAQSSGQTSINIPQLLAVALVGFFAVRWFLSKPAGGASSPGSGAASRGARQVDITKVEQVAAMFPQLDRRTIAWDLHRNGGNVSATTERVLAGRSLDPPPPSYQPDLPSPTTPAPAVGVAGAASKRPGAGQQPDLITRYGLQGRIGGKGKEAVPSAEQTRSSTAWSADKAARADGLKKRREEMILAARRKLEAQQGSAAASTPL